MSETALRTRKILCFNGFCTVRKTAVFAESKIATDYLFRVCSQNGKGLNASVSNYFLCLDVVLCFKNFRHLSAKRLVVAIMPFKTCFN